MTSNDLRILVALLALVVLVVCAFIAECAPVPHLRARPVVRDYAAERARFPDAREVERRTAWLWGRWCQYRQGIPGVIDERWHVKRVEHPVWRAWFIWDDIRLYDVSQDPEWRKTYLDRVRKWLGEADYKRGRLPPPKWWEMPVDPNGGW